MKKTSLIILIMFHVALLCACATSLSSRKLSKDEMQRYHLNGILNEAKICPTEFDEKLKVSKIIGVCEVVSCEMKNDETICFANPESK